MPQDYSQDKDFLAAPLSDKIAYLSSQDKDFAKASRDDQTGYINNIINQAGTRASQTAKDTQASQTQTPLPAWQRFGSGAAAGFKSLVPSMPGSLGEGIEEYGHALTAPVMGAIPAIQSSAEAVKDAMARHKAGEGWTEAAGDVLGKSLGMNVEDIKKRASQGDLAGVVGEAAPQLAMAAIPSLGEAGSAVRERIGGAIHTPEGELTPLAHGIGSAGGAAAGYAAGHYLGLPEIGELGAGAIGRGVGAPLMEKLFPEPVAARNARSIGEGGKAFAEEIRNRPAATPELGSPENPGWNVKLPDRMPEVPKPTPELGSPENPGWVVKIPDRMPNIKETGTMQPGETVELAKPGESFNAIPEKKLWANLGKGVEEAAGWRPLEKNVPIGEQGPANLGGKPTFRREPLIGRVGQLEEGAGRNVAPEKLPEIISNEVGRQMGAEPTPEQAEKQRLQEKYPDRAERQLVKINGEDFHEAVKHDTATNKAVAEIPNDEMRAVAIKGGMNMVREDGSPIMVNDRKMEGNTGDMNRRQVLSELLKRGYEPKQILEMYKQGLPEGKPGPKRSVAWSRLEQRAGD